jgi:hypothetical protein
MINRTYVVKAPAAASYVDIVVDGYAGDPSAPVANPASYPGATLTAPPVGWPAGTAAYYELLGRTLPVQVVGTPGFVPRLNLGFAASLATLTSAGGNMLAVAPPASLALSESLADTFGDGTVIAGLSFPDPAYGPVVRVSYGTLTGSSFELFLVSLQIYESSDAADNVFRGRR